MFWFVVLVILFGPAIFAQIRGHHAAIVIILLNFAADGLLVWQVYIGQTAPDSSAQGQAEAWTRLALAAGVWLLAFFWSIGPSSRRSVP
jgi:hypothetical protein